MATTPETAQPLTRCYWTHVEEGYDSFETTCGHCFEFTDDGPEENGFRYCPYCGRALKAVSENYEDEAEEPTAEAPAIQPARDQEARRVVALLLEAYEAHDSWCGHRKGSPGNSIHLRARDAAKAFLAPEAQPAERWYCAGCGHLPHGPVCMGGVGPVCRCDGQPEHDVVCQHGVASDVACAGCHSGFEFAGRQQEEPPAIGCRVDPIMGGKHRCDRGTKGCRIDHAFTAKVRSGEVPAPEEPPASEAADLPPAPMLHDPGFDCPECGPRVKADEDGCCSMCGRDCNGRHLIDLTLKVQQLTADLDAARGDGYCPKCGSCGIVDCCGPDRCSFAQTYADEFKALNDDCDKEFNRAEAAESQLKQLREVFNAALDLVHVWDDHRSLYVDNRKPTLDELGTLSVRGEAARTVLVDAVAAYQSRVEGKET